MKTFLRIALVCILTLVSGASSVFAQERHQKHADGDRRKGLSKEISEFKIKFLAQEIELSSEKQKQFEELYKAYENEKHEIFSQTMKLERRIKNDKNATDADYEKLKNALTEARVKDAEIEKKYDRKFAAILSQKQIYLMKKAEMAFHDRMKEMHREKRQKRSSQKK